ncbi:MAG TPA: DUF4252 domain-containing protein [Blastocatellia bacterium]|jgi:hypothetical protein|nr:DUF4252 domain-containing protein [Blastocatellia bacterium]
MRLLNSVLVRSATLALLLLTWAAIPAHGQDARIQMGQLDRFSDAADKVIEVTVDEALIKLAISALNPNRSVNEAKVKDILSGLKGIYVKRFEFEKEGAYTAADAESIRSQLNSPGWSRIANVRSKREGNYDVVIMSEGSVIRGLAVLAAEPRALTVVNIVGPIDLAKLRELEGKFGIPHFGIEQMSGMGVTIKDNRKEKTPEAGPDDKQPAAPDGVTDKRAEKKPPRLIRPEKSPTE